MSYKNDKGYGPDDKQCGPVHPSVGRGANIRIVMPDGSNFAHDPAAFRRLNSKKRSNIVGHLMSAGLAA